MRAPKPLRSPLPLLLLLLLLTPLPTLAQTQTRCQWSTLRSATDQVLESLTAGISITGGGTGILASSPSLVYTQNSAALSITSPDSVLSAPLDVAHAHSIVDQEGCAGFVRIVVLPSSSPSSSSSASSDHARRSGSGASSSSSSLGTRRSGRGALSSSSSSFPQRPSGGDRAAKHAVRAEGAAEQKQLLVIGAQIFYNYTFNQGTTVRQIDLAFAREGDWQIPAGLNASALLGHIQTEDWAALSRARQDSRTVLAGVAGAYLDFVGGTVGSGGNGTGTESEPAAAVPWGRPCSRLEGSVYTAVGDAESCEKGLSLVGDTAQGITDRQFVVDESIGAVSVLARDGRLGGAPSVFEFRVVEGKLRYVHQFAATGRRRQTTEGNGLGRFIPS